jgi:uncharacterized protein (DUF1800 family)
MVVAKIRTDADREGHLLRRFSFGSSQTERAGYAGLSSDQLLDRLITSRTVEDPVGPLRYAFLKDQEAQPGAWRFRLHWMYHLVTSEAPLAEKTALFWHNHFAVSDDKVEDGLAMVKYMLALRTRALGPFRDILKAMVTSVAMMKNLDVLMLSRANPNENFAREILELYTLGVGHYTEQDIQELARVMTGHGYIDIFWRLGDNNDKRMLKMLKDETWSSAYVYSPELHDDRPRIVLGKTVHSLDEAVDLLASHPQTAEFVCTKLWKFFGSPTPNAQAIGAMTRAWKKSGGVIAEVLRAMAQSKEFWSDDVVRTLPRSPLDFVVGMLRAHGADKELRDLAKPALPNAPVPKPLDDALGEACFHASRIGFSLLYIPTVAGYAGGDEWISTETMLRKGEFHGVRMTESYQEKGETKWRPAHNARTIVDAIRSTHPKTPLEVAHALNAFYDADLDEAQLKTLEKAVTKHGGMAPLNNPDWMGWQIMEVSKYLRLSPQFSLC